MPAAPHRNLPRYEHPHKSCTSIITDEPTLLHHHHPKPITLKFTHAVVHFRSLHKCIMKCIQDYGGILFFILSEVELG